MKRFTKGLFAGIMLLALILGLLPAIAFANTDEEGPADIDPQSEVGYSLWLGETQVTSLNKDNILGDGTASYDPENQILTLDNPEIEGTCTNSWDHPCKIYADGIDLTITGNVSVEGADYGIYVEGAELTLGGSDNDTITAKGSTAGIWAGGNLYIKGGKVVGHGDTCGIETSAFGYCDIIIENATVEADGSQGIESGHSLTVKNSKITATGTSGGINAENEIGIEKSTVIAEGTSGRGINCRWGLTLTDCETQASGTANAINTFYYSTTVTGGTLTATGGTAIYGGFTMKGDDTVVTITAGNGGDGILSIASDVTITGGTLTVVGKSSGITTKDGKSVSIQNATVDLQGATGINSAGSITIDNATVTGSSRQDAQVNITRTSQIPQAFACGLQAKDSIRIDDSKVTLDVVNNATGSINISSGGASPVVSVQTCGMEASGDIIINSSTVTTTSLSNTAFDSSNTLVDYSCGLQAGNDITIGNQSDVTAKGAVNDETAVSYSRVSYGAYSVDGDITISISGLDATSESTGDSTCVAIIAGQGSIVVVEPCAIVLPREYTFEEGDNTIYEADGTTIAQHAIISLVSIPVSVEMGEGHDALAAAWAAQLPADYHATAEGTRVSLDYPRYTDEQVTSLKTAQTALNDDLFRHLRTHTPAYYDNEEAYLILAQHPISNYTSKGQVESERNASTGALPFDQEFHVLWDVPVRAVDITLEIPTCCMVTVTDEVQDPLPAVSTESEGVHIVSNWWLASGSTWDKFEGTMTGGNEYRARIEVAPDFGYTMGWSYLSEDNVKINGTKAYVIGKNSAGWQLAGTVTAAHAWSDWQTVTPATYASEGLEKRVCTACSTEETRVVPALRSFQRLAGTDRYATGAEIAGAYGATGGTVILATGANFPDALCASALAGKEGAPILMTAPASLSADTAHTLADIQPARIIVVGGTGAVSDSVLAAACTAAGIPCDGEHTARYFGANRFATGLAIYEEGGLAGADTCIIATGGNFADALSISPYAYATQTPIFLADTRTLKLDDATVAAIADDGFERIIIVGGTGVVSDGVADQLGVDPGNVVRLAGASRYDTSLDIAEWEMGAKDQVAFGPDAHIGVSNVSLATGTNFPDALTGGALCGKNASLLLLVSERQADYAGALALVGATTSGIVQGYIFGGTGAVSDTLKAKFDAALN